MVSTPVPGGKTGGVLKAAGRGLGGVFGRIFSLIGGYWKIFFTIAVLATVFLNAGIQSYQERSIEPFVYEVGGRIGSADEILYQRITEGEGFEVTLKKYERREDAPFFYNWSAWMGVKAHNFFAYFDLYWDIFVNLWILYFMFKIFYMIFKSHNESERFFNAMFAVLIMILLQIFLGQMLALNQVANGKIPIEEVQQDKLLYATPFKGVVTLAWNAPKILKPAQKFVESTSVGRPGNLSVYNITDEPDITPVETIDLNLTNVTEWRTNYINVT